MLADSSKFKEWVEPYNVELIYRNETFWGSRYGGYSVRMSPSIYVPSYKTIKDYSYLSYFKDDLNKFTTKFDIPDGGYFMVHSGQRVIIETIETFKLPLEGVALVTHSIPKLALLGLNVSSTVFFSDDFTTRVGNTRVGKLLLSVKNDSERNIQLLGGMPIAIVLFQQYEKTKIPHGFYDYDYTR